MRKDGRVVIDAIDDRSGARYALAFLAVAGVAPRCCALIFPAADPPWNPSVGVVWHDEGAWVHNARNKALFGAWSLDAWNPMYIAPVFTGLEYVAFELFGVGVRQARLVSELTGFAVGPLPRAGASAGSAAARPALAAGALLATNYVYVMYGPGRHDGSVDGRVHGGELVLLRARAGSAALGVARRRGRAAGVLHQGVSARSSSPRSVSTRCSRG